MIKAVLFDFGGVVTTSPFEAFARYEKANDLPVGLIRSINSADPNDNAWAKLERGEVDADGFSELFAVEAAERGYAVDGHTVLELLAGDVRPQMVEAIRRIKAAGLAVACLTNNFKPRPRTDTARTPTARTDTGTGGSRAADVLAMFDAVVESSVVGMRKPELGFYRAALSLLGIEAREAVFIDDLGINLKPAKAMGMTTIKVVEGHEALRQLSEILNLDLLE